MTSVLGYCQDNQNPCKELEETNWLHIVFYNVEKLYCCHQPDPFSRSVVCFQKRQSLGDAVNLETVSM